MSSSEYPTPWSVNRYGHGMSAVIDANGKDVFVMRDALATRLKEAVNRDEAPRQARSRRREKEDRMTFSVGDQVTWSSQAGGRTRQKLGQVVAVVPAGTDVLSVIEPLLEGGFRSKTDGRVRDGRQCRRPDFGLIPRRHESYVVAVGKQLYWPRAKNLRRVDGDS